MAPLPLLPIGIPGLDLGATALELGSYLKGHQVLVNEIAGHGLAHALHSYARRSRRRGLSRRKARKASNMKRRWFVDNIIMHHKRLHDRNRENVISDIRSKVLAKKKEQEKKALSTPALSPQRPTPEREKWRSNLKEKAVMLRGRTDTRKLRARSRWLTLSSTLDKT